MPYTGGSLGWTGPDLLRLRAVLTRADDLASMTVLDDQKQAITVGSLWKDRTAVLVFVRHFG